MDATEYKYLEETLQGRKARDMGLESRMSMRPEPRRMTITEKAEERLRNRKSPEELEMEQREFNLKFFGKSHMEYFARPLTGQGPLYVPGDQVKVKGHSSEEQRPVVPAHLKLKCHHGEPIRQVLQLR